MNDYFMSMIQDEANVILNDGGMKNASHCAYAMKKEYPHIDFDEVFEWVSGTVMEEEDNQAFVFKVSEYAMEFYLDFGTLMTIVSVELAFRVATSGMSGLENVH